MNAVMVITGTGTMVVLTSHASVTEPALIQKLAHKGIDKFIAFDLPLELAKERYGGHFGVVAGDLHESDDFRVLDYAGDRAFKLFSFAEMGEPILYDGSPAPAAVEPEAKPAAPVWTRPPTAGLEPDPEAESQFVLAVD